MDLKFVSQKGDIRRMWDKRSLKCQRELLVPEAGGSYNISRKKSGKGYALRCKDKRLISILYKCMHELTTDIVTPLVGDPWVMTYF